MPVTSETSRSGPYNGNGATTEFAYTFRILDKTHLQVVKTSTAGVDSTLTVDTDYTVTGVGDALGGNVVATTAPASGEKITIIRNVPLTQETDLQNQGAYYADVVETMDDKAMMAIQQLNELIGRSLTLPASSAFSNLLLPDPAADRVLGWNSSATDLENMVAELANVTSQQGSDLASLSTFIGTLLPSTTAAAARSILDVPRGKELAAFPSRTDASSATIADHVTVVLTLGYHAAGDGGGAYYVAGSGTPKGSFTSNAAAKTWVLAEQPLNVKMFGARGVYESDTGVDDTTAFQDAIDYLEAQTASNDSTRFGGKLVVPRGNYKLTSKVTIDTHGVEIVGESMTDTIITVAHAGRGLELTPDASGSPSNIQRSIRIADLKFQSTETSNTTGSAAIWCEDGNLIMFILERLWIASQQQYGIYLENVQDGHIQNVRIDGPSGSSTEGLSYGIRTLGIGNQLHIESCWIENTLLSGIFISGDSSFSANAVNIVSCLLQGNQRMGVLFEKVNLLRCIGCWFEENGRGGAVNESHIESTGTDFNQMVVLEGNMFGGATLADSSFRALGLTYISSFICQGNFFTTGSIIQLSTTLVKSGVIEHNASTADDITINLRPNGVHLGPNWVRNTGALWSTASAAPDPVDGRVVVLSGGETTYNVYGVGTLILSNGSATTLSSLTGAIEGQRVRLIASNGNTTLAHTGTLADNIFRLPSASDITPGLHDALELQYATLGANSLWVLTCNENNT